MTCYSYARGKVAFLDGSIPEYFEASAVRCLIAQTVILCD